MARSERPPGRSRRVRRAVSWVAGVLVLALAGGTAAAYETGRLDDWFGNDTVPPSQRSPRSYSEAAKALASRARTRTTGIHRVAHLDDDWDRD